MMCNIVELLVAFVTLVGVFSIPTAANVFENADATTDIVIQRGLTVVLPVSGLIQVQRLIVRGTLVCSPDAKARDYLELVAANITVNGGLFQCSRSLEDTSRPYNGQLKVTVNDKESPVINVVNNGTLLLRGQNDKNSWSRITSTLNAGGNKVEVVRTQNWRVNDEVVIAPSDYDYTEYEMFKILEISSGSKPHLMTLTLNRPAKFMHYGNAQQFGKHTLMSRAEIALLTRSIKLYGDCDNFERTNIGISISMLNEALAQIDNVEIRCAGHMDVLGRYPIHFHHLGTARGNVFSNSSIFKSSNRCLSIHCSDEVLIERVSCTDHIGHGFYFEDGSESGNVLRRNLGITTRPGSGKLNPTDVVPKVLGEAAGLATFWSAATNNTFMGNTAAGSAWMGFAFDGSDKIIRFIDKASICKTRYKNFPWDIKNGKLGLQQGFIAHSTGSSGYWIDGYSPTTDYAATDIQVYKTMESGIHMGFNGMTISNFIVSDTLHGLWSTFTSTFRNGAVIGRSVLAEVGKYSARLTGKHIGMFVYDGPTAAYNVDFFNFNPHPGFQTYVICQIEMNGGARTSGKNLFAGITFTNPNRPVFCNKQDFNPKLWDLDGSISGEPGSFISNVMTQDIENGGFDVLLNDGSCKRMPGTNGRLNLCGPKTKASYLNLQVQDVQPEDKPFMVSVSGKSERRRIPIRGVPFNDYEVFLRPYTAYRFNYVGNVRCFGYDLYDMLENEWYHLIFTRNGAPLNSLSDTIPQLSSKEELYLELYWGKKTKQILIGKELHVVFRSQSKPISFDDQNGRSIGLTRTWGKVCF